MTRYRYKALKNNSVEVVGYLEATSKEEAHQKILQLGVMPTNIYEEVSQKPAIRPSNVVKSLSLNDKILFTSELSVMLTSGITPVEALETAELHAPNSKIKTVAADLKQRILKGSTFTDALRAYEHVFGNIYISLCDAGENSGTLEKSMEYLTMVLKKQDELKGRIISMSVYPICLLVILVAVYLLCGLYVFPKFIESSNISESQIPFMVNVIMVPCQIMFANWFSVLVTSIIAVFGAMYVWSLDSFQKFLDRTLLKTPKVKDFVQYVNLSAFFTVLNVSYEAGVPISSALKLSSGTIKNSVVKHQADNVERMVTNGQMLSKSFSVTGLVPPVLNVLVASGEKAGRLGQMFRDIAIAIDKQLESASDILMKAFEPVLLTVIGCVVGYIAVAFFQMFFAAFVSFG